MEVDFDGVFSMTDNDGPSAGHEQERQRLVERLAEIDYALPGSLGRRENVCGKPGCRCKADPPQLHGPYYLWTRKVDGKTVTRMLTDEQARATNPGSTTRPISDGSSRSYRASRSASSISGSSNGRSVSPSGRGIALEQCGKPRVPPF